MSIRIGITGAAGRMGRMLAEVVSEAERPCSLVVAIERAESSLLGADMGELLGDGTSGVTITSDLVSVASDIDVLIDFTVPEATLTSCGAMCGAWAALGDRDDGFFRHASGTAARDNPRSAGLSGVQL